eukprot:g75809.t1
MSRLNLANMTLTKNPRSTSWVRHSKSHVRDQRLGSKPQQYRPVFVTEQEPVGTTSSRSQPLACEERSRYPDW